MRLACVDTYYPQAIAAMPIGTGTYQEELDKILARQFGTADFLTRELRKLGWEAVDIIANHSDLQARWARENHGESRYLAHILEAQIQDYNPDVIFFQDLSLEKTANDKGKRLIIGQCSCPWPGDDIVRMFDVIFTSFPHYLPRIESLGVKAVYMPLAFSTRVIEAISEDREEFECETGEEAPAPKISRELDCVFVGGVGNPSHWAQGMKTLKHIADEIPTFHWWGYGMETLPASRFRQQYCGDAWGRDMYDILLRSKIVINRHGEVAEGFANNMRMYEATGCGALLLTDNQTDLFADNEIVRYSSPEDAVMKIRYYLKNESERAAIAARGQRRTLRDHTYGNRVPKIAEVLIAFKAGDEAGYSTEVARNFWKEPSCHYGR